MVEPGVNDASSTVTLLIEHSHGTIEVVLHRVETEKKTGFVTVEVLPVSGSRHILPTHSCLGNAISMQKWMEAHPEVFTEGLTSFD